MGIAYFQAERHFPKGQDDSRINDAFLKIII